MSSIEKSPNSKRKAWTRWEGYFLIPHELLHVLGFRLIGKQCQYKWGQPRVTPLETLTRAEKLFTLLLPFCVFLGGFFILGLATGWAFSFVVRRALIWPFLGLAIGTFLSIVYLSSTMLDVRKAYLIIRNKPWSAPTPFDIIFWPYSERHAWKIWDETENTNTPMEMERKDEETA